VSNGRPQAFPYEPPQIASLHPNDKVVLIGYSGGGFAITRVAEELNSNPGHRIDFDPVTCPLAKLCYFRWRSKVGTPLSDRFITKIAYDFTNRVNLAESQ
jgi:hypothetical protein